MKLAIIAEGPDEDERAPFSKGSSVILANALARHGIPLEKVFCGYVSKRKSYGNPQSLNDLPVIEGCKILSQQLQEFQPNCCLLLGPLANKVFDGPSQGIHFTRGTIFRGVLNFQNYKCISTFETAQIQKVWKNILPFKRDIATALSEAENPNVSLPKREYRISLSFSDLCTKLQNLIDTKPLIAFDVEGVPDACGVTCYSVATSPYDIFIVPFRNMDKTPYWSLEEETELWRLTSLLLSNPEIPKITQNGMYESFILAWKHNIICRGIIHDTMYQQWELFSELPKDLGFIASMYTQEPYYKDERVIPDVTTHFLYCCKDSAVTFESNQAMSKSLTQQPESEKHYRFNISLIEPYTYATLRGCKLDIQELNSQKTKILDFISNQQHIVNEMVGSVMNTKSHVAMKKYLYETLNLKPVYEMKGGEKKITSDFGALCKLYNDYQLPVLLEIAKLTKARTRFSDLNKLVPFADGRMRCTYNPVGSETGRLSSSATFVRELVRQEKIVFKKRTKNKVVTQEISLEPVSEIIELGTNLQNVTEDVRSCFVADDDCQFFQYDLSGADAWTVAADCCAMGNDKMLKHLLYGIKPSIVIVLLNQFGQDTYRWDISELKTQHDIMLKRCKTEPPLIRTYVSSKACQHGTNYGMQPPLMAALQLERSVTGWVENQINGNTYDPNFTAIHSTTMARLQKLYIDYYGIELRNEYLARQLCNHGYIQAASGQRRHFLNIRNRSHIDQATIRIAASFEPQANTTYVTNLALTRMYYDKENRTKNNNLKCEPLLMVHDALGGQSRNHHLQFSQARMSYWFENQLIINNQQISIPVEGGWGPNWKDTK